MKNYKLLTLAALAGLMMTTAPVLAEHHSGKGDKGKKFEMADTNGDGQVSMDEFLAKAKEKFAKKDANGDGFISKEEAKQAREAKREMRKEKRAHKKDSE